MKFTEALRKNSQFRRLYSKGKSVANRQTVMYVMKNGMEGNRLGITVSKKIGNSVVRNRVKRLIKENYRLIEENIVGGVDIVVIARQPIAECDFYGVGSSLSHLLNKASLFKTGF